MKVKIAAALAATCLVLASCGGDDSSSGGGDGLSGAVTDALAAQIEADGAPTELGQDEIACIAGKVLENDEMNTALQAAYDEGKEGEELLNAVDESASFEADASIMMLQCLSAEQIVDLLAGEMGGEEGMTDEQRTCLIDEFEKMNSDELATGFMAMAEGTEGDEAAGALMSALVTCVGSEF
jgi:hypothetical protein